MGLCLILAMLFLGDTAASNYIIPVKTIASTSKTCPPENELAEAKSQIKEEIQSLIALALDLGSRENPAGSCDEIPAGSPSGDYWILPAIGQPAVQVYCDFNRQCGCDGPSTWTRAAFLNMSDPGQNCPENWTNYTSPVRACGAGTHHSSETCVSTTFPVHSQLYNRVCGRILGYQNEATGAFHSLLQSRSIEESYLAGGVSLTHGNEGSRQHIWSFASAFTDNKDVISFIQSDVICQCSSNATSWSHNISFVGNDYFCDSGNHENSSPDGLFSADPLWDGAGCSPTSTCCEFNNPPWFCKALLQPTSNDLEVRVCTSQNHDAPIQLIELYVQ